MLRLVVVFGLACLLGLVIQAVLIHGLFPSAIAPDFITVLIVYIALHHRTPLGAVGAFSLGVLEDFASGQFVGPCAAGAVVAFIVSALIADKVYAERLPALVALTALASTAKAFTFLGVIALYVRVNLLSAPVVWVVLAEALLSAVVAPIVVKLLQPGRQYASVKQFAARESLRWSH